MFLRKWIVTVLGAGAMVFLAGCVQYPTESKSVVDLRPEISFRFNPADPRMNDARVLVDGLDVGRMGDFSDGKGTLRVLSGNHVVRVVYGAEVLHEERAYIGDGVVRPFIVK